MQRILLSKIKKDICEKMNFYIRSSRSETLAQVFSCEFCKISKNTFFYRTPLVAASKTTYQEYFQQIISQC